MTLGRRSRGWPFLRSVPHEHGPHYHLDDSESRRAMSGVPFGDPEEPSRTDPKQAQEEHNSDARKVG